MVRKSKQTEWRITVQERNQVISQACANATSCNFQLHLIENLRRNSSNETKRFCNLHESEILTIY